MAGKTKKTTTASTVRYIRRNNRKRYLGEGKIRIGVKGRIEVSFKSKPRSKK